jgi:hypothetical protein
MPKAIPINLICWLDPMRYNSITAAQFAANPVIKANTRMRDASFNDMKLINPLSVYKMPFLQNPSSHIMVYVYWFTLQPSIKENCMNL